MWFFGGKKGSSSGFSSSSTAEQVTQGIDGSGLTAIVTGASSGIGEETTRVLAMRGVHVIMAVRNVEAGNKVKEKIVLQEKIHTEKIAVMEMDLSSLASVRKFALEFISLGIPLNILINNAGTLLIQELKFSEDNIELNFATNHIGHFLLTNLLLETIKTTASQSQVEGRVINVSSSCHLFVGLHLDKINDNTRVNSKYPMSKLANILHAKELTRLLKEEGVAITANSLHPGIIYTRLFRHDSIYDYIFKALSSFLFKNVQQGAATTCYMALNPKVNGVSGEYFEDCNVSKASALAGDSKLAKELWDFSMKLIHQYLDPKLSYPNSTSV